jgi:hypothetical protein
MKYLIFILMSSLAISGLNSCQKKDDERKPLFQSDKKPLPVTNVQVTNIEGGAVITYKLPEDPSILYVQADYMINDKVTRQEKVSYYSDSIRVSGFANASEYKVVLYSVSRSEVKSDSVAVTVNPLNPPYRTIAATLFLQDAFGGVNISCQNPTEAEVGIGLVVDSGRIQHVQTKYTKLTDINYNVLGFQLKAYRMGAYVIDKWGNISDTVWKTITPMFETQLNRSLMQNGALPGDGTANPGWGANFNTMLTGTGVSASCYGVTGTAGNRPRITVALGVTAKLSRFKFYQTTQGPTTVFNNVNPKKFQVWASMNPNPNGALDGTWTLLGTFDLIKPSGNPTLGTNSPEDVNAANDGHEYSFPLPAVTCKYVRIVCIDTWLAQNDTRLKMGAIYFYGDNR